METPSLIFLGSGDFGAQVLESLYAWDGIRITTVVTQPDKPVGRAQELTANPVALLAKKYGLPILQPKKLDDAFALWLSQTKPDAAIVASYGKLIPEAVLAIPPKGFVNIHPSLLPKYRGASPVAGALRNGETETGVSIMLLDKGLDTGPILQQEKYPIRPNIMREALHHELAKLGAKMLQECLLPYLHGELQPAPQENDEVSLTQILSREDGKIDWSKSAQDIYNLYQAMDAWPGIWTTWNGQILKVLEITVPDEESTGEAGTTLVADHQLLVQCGKGRIRLHTLQMAGKTPQAAETALRGYAELANTRFG